VTDGKGQHPIQALQDHHTRFQVAVFHFRVQALPEVRVQTLEQPEPITQAGKVMLLDQGFEEPAGELEVFTASRQGFCRQGNDGWPIGRLDVALPLPLFEGVIGPACLFDDVIGVVVKQRLTRRVVSWDRRQERCKVENLW
jgi:hypothetical protein